MFGLWVAEFGLTPESFWSADVTEFTAAYEAWVERNKRDFFLTGSVIATLYNVNSKKGSKTLTAEDIFPHLKSNDEKPRAARGARELESRLWAIAAAQEKKGGADGG